MIRSKIFFLAILSILAINSAIAQRTKFNFNHNWKLHVGDVSNAERADFDDKNWKSITLPYAWNQDEAYLKDIVDLSTGIAWYRKTFQLPESADVKKTFVEFEGVRQVGEVYVNGEYVGLHENGVMAFGFDISTYLKPYPAENIIAVKTNNDWDYKEKFSNQKYQWSDRNFNANYGGIPKNVYLHTTTSEVYQTLPLYSSLGTTGTYVYATDIDIEKKQANIHVSTQVRNESKKSAEIQLNIIIKDLDGEKVLSFEGVKHELAAGGTYDFHAADTLRNAHFWSIGYGYLYDVTSEILIDGKVVDAVNTRTGFRKTAFKDGMIYLNDRVAMMKGYAQRTSNEWPSLGMSIPAWLSDYSNSLILKENGNYVRWMHVTPWKQDVESADRVGLILAMPAGDAEKDVFDYRWTQRTSLMRDAIIYNRNNPSILFYECGNESVSEEHMAEMKTIRNMYDPFGGRAIGSREMLDSKEAEYGGEMLYINKSADIPLFATEYCRDEASRKYWDDYTTPYHKNGEGPLYRGKPASDYNRNQDGLAIENTTRWFDYWEMRPGTGTRVSSGGAKIIFSDSNTHHRGEENFRRSGSTDAMRIPKDSYWAHDIIWDGWVDTDTVKAHILGHWNYDKGTVKDEVVISTADEVELFVNGKSLGKGEQSKRFIFTFKDVKFAAGEVKAVGYIDGKKVCESSHTTAGEPYAVRLSTIERLGGMLADGQDVAIVEVEVIDEKGQRCPTALNMIDFKLSGVGEYIGGIAMGEGNYIGQTTLPVECGVNRIFVRSINNKAGKMKITASSKGLKSDNVSILTKETDTQDLSEVLTYDALPSYLNEGETLATPSYTVSRVAIPVTSIVAGSNQEDACKTIDDNELSQWDNDGNLATAHIEYTLKRKANINQVVLKLAGWRSKRYPIDVYIDSKKVWSDKTPTSLGYVTLTFEPTEGQTVKLALSGSTKEDGSQFSFEELAGHIEGAGNEDKKGSNGALRIVEVEFYEQAK
ncbi:MAG: glycoside hydrolase family 2 protein [Mangrovibacterium sp.]